MNVKIQQLLCINKPGSTCALFAIFLFVNCFSTNAQTPIYGSESVHHPVVGQEGMVASQHALATQVGIDILKMGGNAIDAAVGVGFALAVVLPRAGNIGGGGFMLVHLKKENITKAINYREMAPQLATADMYLDQEGNVDKQSYNQSYKSVGVPGTVAGLVHALENYGTMSLKEVLKPAIKLAAKGFPITYDLARVLQQYEKRLSKSEATKAIFLKENGFLAAGDRLIQSDLAWSLKQIAKSGRDGFYKGKVAQKIVEDVQENGGILSMDDFANYIITETDPVFGEYKGHKIASMPPPSSGGVHIIQMLNILEQLPIGDLEHNSADMIHYMVEAMRFAYADRSQFLGDPAFCEVPEDGLVSKDYAKQLSKKIKGSQATKSTDVNPGKPFDFESEETTHFSVVDKAGNVVSNTYTLNFSFGTGLVAEGTGIILNNEMGDFAAKVGFADAYGLIGGKLNEIVPGKRPLSSMTPTIVFKNGQPFLVTGSPGGSRIITTVLQIILNVLEFDMNVAEATHATRIHHQWYPDVLFYEKPLSIDTRNLLQAKGHELKIRNAMGSTQSIMLKDGFIFGASDTRRPDARTYGY